MRQLRRLLGQSELVAAEVPSDAEVAAMAAAVAGSGDWDPGANGSLSDLALPSHSPWPTALDWRTYRGGGWLSAPVDILSTLPRPCVGATHVVSALASVEARIRIRTDLRQSEHLSIAEALACTPHDDPSSCDGQHSAFLVGKYGREFGLRGSRASRGPDHPSRGLHRCWQPRQRLEHAGRPQCGQLGGCEVAHVGDERCARRALSVAGTATRRHPHCCMSCKLGPSP